MCEPFATGDQRAADALGPAVGLEHPIGADPIDPGPHQPIGTGGPARHDPLERREVVARPDILWKPPDAMQHRRHEIHPLDALGLDQPQRLLGIEAAHQHDEPPAHQTLSGVQEGAGVKERARDQDDGLGVHAVVQGLAIEARGLGVEDQLRPSGAPARGDRVRVGRGPVGKRQAGPFGAGARRIHSRRVGPRRVRKHQAGRVAVRGHPDDQPGIGELDDRPLLVLRQAVREGDRHATQLPRREHALEEGDAIGKRDRDAVARPHAELTPRPSARIRCAFEVRPGRRAPIADDRRPRRRGVDEQTIGGGKGEERHGFGYSGCRIVRDESFQPDGVREKASS